MVKPIVSILIPTYNHAATLERCLRSVLEQDYEPMQVVVLDNLWTAPEVWCDGLRRTTAPNGTSVVARVGRHPLRLARLDDTPFATRLVRKFDLPVRGWRSRSAGIAGSPE